jgi:hypothetical protein
VSEKVDFPTFFAVWAEIRRWDVPDIHWRAIYWLEHTGNLAVLRCFRGFGKSTILAVYNAWRYYSDNSYRILHQSESDKTAYKTSRDTQAVLRKHPLTKHLLNGPANVESWFINGAAEFDSRNASMYAKGITSNVTSARADECQNDDVEVPRNIATPEAREKLRYRLGEQTHILVPGGRKLYIGTPHTHDSLYDEMERAGADCLTIRMFELEFRIDNPRGAKVFEVPFKPEFIFCGISQDSRLLFDGVDYHVTQTENGYRVVFMAILDCLIDIYGQSSWPERFDRAELAMRRRSTKTIGEWDSQYQLHSKPITDTRLDPSHIQAYSDEPRFVTANKVLSLWLGGVQIVSCSLRWDPSSGKLNSDKSGVVLDFQDGAGRHYWHRVMALKGDIIVTSEDGRKVIGGQVFELVNLVEKYRIPRVTVETNGIGQFAPANLRMALKQRGLVCSVVDKTATANKNKRILEALEPLLQSRMLWAHVSVLGGDLWDEMKDWQPGVSTQPDDLLDAGAGAVTDQPVRLVGKGNILDIEMGQNWQPDAGIFEASLD